MKTIWQDKKTKLIWQREVTLEKFTFLNKSQLLERVNNSQLGEFNDWRIPSLAELRTLLKSEPNKNKTPISFQTYIKSPLVHSMTMRTQSFLSNTEHSKNSCWIVGFGVGTVYTYRKQAGYYIRCVRN
jgi:hypothetical protein